MAITIPPGVFDIVPKDSKEIWRSSYLWNHIETIMRDTARCYGYQEIRTPVFERTELFQRGVGEGTDIVSKEMYTFLDKGERSMSLRPEGTAPAIRSFIENQMFNEGPIHKLYYIAPMFRYERAQAGRYRQHHQFGVEAIGISAPEQDVEIIDLIYTIFCKLGLTHLQVGINSIGNVTTRTAYRDALRAYLKDSFEHLSADSKVRFDTNPLRILDSKDPRDKKIIADAPSILDFLDEEAKDHFEQVKKLLNGLKIPYQVNSQLVRGLDYYNKTVFEIVAGELGAQNSIVGGGRYDGLIKTLGGPDLPSLGFGCGIERVIQTMLKQQCPLPMPYRPALFIIPLGQQATEACFTILHDLRANGLSAQMDFTQRKLNKIMHYADTIQAQYVAIIGDNELQAGEVELKEMATGEKTKIAISQIYHHLLGLLKYV